MTRTTPPTPPPSSTSKRTSTGNNNKNNDNNKNINKSGSTTPLPVRTIQDHGTVGAVANAGSDLSYDLSSNSSAGLDLNVKKNRSADDDGDSDIDMDGDANYDNTNNGNGNGSRQKVNPPKSTDGDDDDDVSLDEDKLKYGTSDQLLGFSEIIIQDMSQLKLDRSKSAEFYDNDDYNYDNDDNNSDNGDNDGGDDRDDDGDGGDGVENNEDILASGEAGVESNLEQVAEWINSGKCSKINEDILASVGTGVELNLEHIAEWIKNGKCSKIVVLCGAGVSCSAGIPDFRTPGTGLYDNLEKYNLPYPEAVFDLSFYQSNPLPFVSLAKEIWPGTTYSPTLSHSFISLLSSKNLLVRNYTQNIDGLELLSGVNESKIVECHGHFRTSSCIACGVPYDGKKCMSQIVDSNEVPICPKCGCLVKPDIVFFGESLPVRFKNLLHSDLGSCDLLIVMGTSLKVAPVSLIPEMVNSHTPRVLINRELVGDFVPPGVEGNYRDVFEEGDCDDSVRRLCSFLGWEDELLELNEKTRIG